MIKRFGCRVLLTEQSFVSMIVAFFRLLGFLHILLILHLAGLFYAGEEEIKE